MYLYTTKEGKGYIAESDTDLVTTLQARAPHYPTASMHDYMRLVSKWSYVYAGVEVETHSPEAFVKSMIKNKLLTKEAVQ